MEGGRDSASLIARLRGPQAVRVYVVALVVLVGLQIVARPFVDEPWPGLFQPSFGGVPFAGDAALTIEPLVTVEDASGEETTVAVDDVLPRRTGVLRATVFRNAFYDEDRANEPGTAAWLRGQVAPLVDGEPVRVRIEWQRIRYRISDGSRSVAETLQVVEIPFTVDR